MVTALENSDALGLGVYTPSQAAYLARLHPNTMRRWLCTDPKFGPIVERQTSSEESGVVSFLEFVQLLAVRAIRRKHRLKMSQIREVVSLAESQGIRYPFARKHSVFLIKSENQIALRMPGGDLIAASGASRTNYLMERVLEPYLDDLTFSDEGFADAYRPLSDGVRNVLLTPKRQWGAPVIESKTSQYTVHALLMAVQSEGSIEAAAEMCDVDLNDIRLALKYDDLLSGVAA